MTLSHKGLLTLRSTEALRSLTALVAGITMISLSTVHTSDIQTCWAGERDTMCALMIERVGFSVDGPGAKAEVSISN